MHVLSRPCDAILFLNAIVATLQVMQAALASNPSPDPRLDPSIAGAEDNQMGVGSQHIFLGKAHYGCLATIAEPVKGPIQVQILDLHVAIAVSG